MKTSKNHKPIRWAAPVLACLVVAVVGAVVLPTVIQRPPVAPSTTRQQENAGGAQTYSINEGTSPAYTPRSLFNLNRDDYVAMSQAQLAAFYGVNFVPRWMPADLQHSPFELGIYRREAGKGEPYWTQNHLFYYDANGGHRSIGVTVSADSLFSELSAEPRTLKQSELQGVMVVLSHIKAGSSEEALYDSYYADFCIGKTYFSVETIDLTEAEFLRVVHSLIAAAQQPLNAQQSAAEAFETSAAEPGITIAPALMPSDEPAGESPSTTQAPGIPKEFLR
ncbi:MAG: hypothetical protein LBG83_06870 [Oscillospiraceae bacterium]|nr:hypothetical protein [Oscillospiraceae bacterium]